MASFALQKFKALTEQNGGTASAAGSEPSPKPPPTKRQRNAAGRRNDALASRFESAEVKEARRKKEEDATKIFMEKERERQVKWAFFHPEISMNLPSLCETKK